MAKKVTRYTATGSNQCYDTMEEAESMEQERIDNAMEDKKVLACITKRSPITDVEIMDNLPSIKSSHVRKAITRLHRDGKIYISLREYLVIICAMRAEDLG